MAKEWGLVSPQRNGCQIVHKERINPEIGQTENFQVLQMLGYDDFTEIGFPALNDRFLLFFCHLNMLRLFGGQKYNKYPKFTAMPQYILAGFPNHGINTGTNCRPRTRAARRCAGFRHPESARSSEGTCASGRLRNIPVRSPAPVPRAEGLGCV